VPLSSVARAATKDELVNMLKVVDDRQRNSGDWRSVAYIEQKEKNKVAVVYEALVFRRSADAKFMILFTKPKSSQGQGYLRVDENLWFYDPSVGKWERRTERERIGGTNSRRSDFDESRLAEEYDPEDSGEEKLGAYTAQVMTLHGKPGIDLAFPVIKLWVDKARTTCSNARSSRSRASCCAPRIIPSGRRSSASRARRTSGTRRSCASTTRSRRRTRR